MRSSELFLFRQIEPDVTVMDFTGRLTTPGIIVADVETMISKRIERGSRKLVLDLGKVDFVDSSGVGMMMVCWSKMNKAGGTMVIAGAAGHVKRALESVCLDRTIRMYPDVAAACQGMAASPTPSAG